MISLFVCMYAASMCVCVLADVIPCCSCALRGKRGSAAEGREYAPGARHQAADPERTAEEEGSALLEGPVSFQDPLPLRGQRRSLFVRCRSV